jgi:GNAT superfamily N-acetyltransferase
MVCLEDSVTAPLARGRGVAPAAWSAIADELAGEGVRRMITKVRVDNLPSRKAVEKVGFEGVALMHFKRIGPLRRTSVRRLEERRGRYFAEALDPGSLDRTSRTSGEDGNRGGTPSQVRRTVREELRKLD